MMPPEQTPPPQIDFNSTEVQMSRKQLSSTKVRQYAGLEVISPVSEIELLGSWNAYQSSSGVTCALLALMTDVSCLHM